MSLLSSRSTVASKIEFWYFDPSLWDALVDIEFYSLQSDYLPCLSHLKALIIPANQHR